MLTPLEGFDVFTVNVYVVGGGGVVVVPPPPPHAVSAADIVTAVQSTTFCRKSFIAILRSINPASDNLPCGRVKRFHHSPQTHAGRLKKRFIASWKVEPSYLNRVVDVVMKARGEMTFGPFRSCPDARTTHGRCTAMRCAAFVVQPEHGTVPEPNQVPRYPRTFNAGRFRPSLSTHILGIIQAVELLP